MAEAAFFGICRKGEPMIRFILCAALLCAVCSAATAYDRPPQKPAIVLSAFGTTEVTALKSIFNIKTRVEKAFPDYDVHLAFTSNIIRSIWHKRADDAAFRKENPDIPEEVYHVGNTLSTLGNIQERGARLVLVQSLHVTDGEEYTDLVKLVATLEGISTFKASRHPFPWIGVGEPALGTGDGQPAYLQRAAKAIGPLVDEARARNASLVLMAHGNEHLTQGVYAKFQDELRRQYGPNVWLGTVEAPPLGEDIAKNMAQTPNAPRNVLLAPMMVVAGDHAHNDMAGEEEDSWASLLKAEGFEVSAHLVGLGSNDSWADIYVEHLKALEKVVQAKKAQDEAAGK